MRRADRLLQLIQILRRHRRPVTGDKIAAELEVSLRTVYRDIASLIADGVPVRGEAGIGYVLGEGYDLPPLMFNADELEAIMLGLRWVARRGDQQLSRAAHDTVAKIGTVLPPALKPFLYDASLLVPPNPVFPDSIDVAMFRAAIRDGQKIHLKYSNAGSDITERIIWPFAIAYFDASRNVIAWCELRQDYRFFRTDRVITATTLAEKYPKRRAQLLSGWRAQMLAEEGTHMQDVFA
jgi:predicted DNA-binding transcriptional regulator YafY